MIEKWENISTVNYISFRINKHDYFIDSL